MDVKPGYKLTEVGVIPDDWEIRAVSEKGRVTTGKALAVDAPGKPRRYLRTKNVMDGHIVLDDVLCMPMTDEQFALFEVRSGDVLLNEGQSLELVGRCAMYRGELGEPCAIQNQLIRFRAYDEVSPHFATHLFRHCQQSRVFAKIALQTTSIAHLGGVRFARLNLAWPKTQIEQDAIAEVLSDADSLASALSHLIAKKRGLKQAAMQQLLTGQTRLPGFHGEWEVKKLAELGHWRGGVTPSMAESTFWAGGDFPWVASGDVKVPQLNHTSSRITEWAVRSGAAVVVPAGSLLVVMRSGILRKFLPVAVAGRDMAINQDIKGLVPFSGYSSNFMLQLLTFFGQQVLETCMKAGTTVESIELTWLKSFEVSVPQLEEQQAIASVLADMDAEISALEARRDKTLALKQAMMQELLTGRTRLV